MSSEDFLAHYGKKGMRWGVRKAPATTASQRKKKKSSSRSVAIKKLKDWRNKQRLKPSTKAKKIHQLSDAELNSGIARLKKEVEYRNLTQDLYNPKKKLSQLPNNAPRPESILKKALGVGAVKVGETVGTTVGRELSSVLETQTTNGIRKAKKFVKAYKNKSVYGL